jgi:Tfp pilus assembly protein PilX
MFIIEFLAYVAPPGSPVGYVPAPGDPEMYRVTALATGGSPNSRVLLQSTYRKEP